MDIIIISLPVALGLYMAWNIGANDAANAMADWVGSGAVTVKQAIAAAAVCEFLGAVLAGSHVTETVSRGIVDPAVISDLPGIMEGDSAAILVLGMCASLFAAAIVLHFASLAAVPVSATHAIVGAISGFGIAAAGFGAVNWVMFGKITAGWFISPVAGAVAGYITFRMVSTLILGHERPARAAMAVTPVIVFFLSMVVTLAALYKGIIHIVNEAGWLASGSVLLIPISAGIISAFASRIYVHYKLNDKVKLPISDQLKAVEQTYAPLLYITSCSMAFAHGSNDVANAAGPLAVVARIIRAGAGEMNPGIPLWILFLGGGGIVLGLATFGHRVMIAKGVKIMDITPTRRVAADIAATVTMLACTALSLPVSAIHILVGSIIGIGLARGLSGVNGTVIKKIFTSWLIIVPAAALASLFFFIVGRILFLGMVKRFLMS